MLVSPSRFLVWSPHAPGGQSIFFGGEEARAGLIVFIAYSFLVLQRKGAGHVEEEEGSGGLYT